MPRLAALFFSLAVATPATARVTGYTVRHDEGRTELTSVTVARGKRVVVFGADALIGVRITHFRSTTAANIIVPAETSVPTGAARGRLLDIVLNSGVINPGAGDGALAESPVLVGADATPGMAFEFDRPVVNLPGDDLVVFEMQRQIASPLEGDPFHICPLAFESGLRGITVDAFDIQFADSAAQPLAEFCGHRTATPPRCLRDLLADQREPFIRHDDFKALAVGIDLSDLGYTDGASVRGLFLQSARAEGPVIDPVCIVGLPAPEPPNVLAEAPSAVVTVGPSPVDVLEDALVGPMKEVKEIVFAVRVPGNDHWYANFGYYASPVREYPPQREPNGVRMTPIYKDGGRLCTLDVRTRDVTVLLDDPKGSVRDPQVHYDAGRILFSYRREGTAYFHLYEIGMDGKDLRQLTDGPFNDLEPTYTSNGDIVFVSDRCRRFVNCWLTPVATVHRCDADGGGIRMLSSNIEHDNTPWPLPDGRVLYMRWEYVDRSQSDFHHLWTMNPDGTGQTAFFGNMHPGTAMLDAKPIPGTRKVVASFSPGHGRPEHAGTITIVDPSLGPDVRASARHISRGGPVFRDPYALTEDCLLVAEGPRILVMDSRGRTEVLYALPAADRGRFCHEPRPVLPRPRERIIPARVDLTEPTGQLFLQDVTCGRNMGGVKPGEIVQLLVMEQLPKPVNFSGGPWPISNGGTFTLARILGTVPVAPDGSAHFIVPAMRSLFFVALDANGLAVKRMHSFLTVQPGERVGCVGCHESRTTAPLASRVRPAGMCREPDTIMPIDGVPDVLELPMHVQPILDRHCVRCHNPDTYAGRVDLAGDHTPLFSQSYWTLLQHCLVVDGRNEKGNTGPRTVGSSASRLLAKFDGSHKGVKATSLELKTVRLWIDSSAPYAGTYGALGSGLVPVEFPVETMQRRCGTCHGHAVPENRGIAGQTMFFRFGKGGPAEPLVHTFNHLRDVRARIGYFKHGHSRSPQSLCNLSRPEKSLLLRAPLAKSAGGLGLCKADGGDETGAAVFATTADPGFQSILAEIANAKDRLVAEKRFDMQGFRPNDYYLHQMHRYGILKDPPKPREPVDPYALDRAYWRSFEYSPAASGL